MGNCFRTASQIVDPVETRFKYQTPTIVTGKIGRGPGELGEPCGVAIDGTTNQIFVANNHNFRVEIFSETGEYLYHLGAGQLTRPYGIAIYGESIYVSCGDDTVNKLSLTDMSLVRKIGGWGSNNGQFKAPLQLTTDPIGRVFIPDINNYRICIHDPNLNHLYNITFRSMTHPLDVKISRDRLYVLYPYNDICMYVLTLEGDKIHSLIPYGNGEGVKCPLFFCLDPINNFIISDLMNSIYVYSPEGNLLYTIGKQEMFKLPQGVAITPNGRLVCVSRKDDYYGLRIFSS